MHQAEDTISLRSVTSDNFVIIDTTGGEDGTPEVIGEVDFSSALTTVHPKAIYIHQGQQYHVERLDFEQRKAYVKRVDVDYFTDAIRYTQVRVLEIAELQRSPRGVRESTAEASAPRLVKASTSVTLTIPNGGDKVCHPSFAR
jgi:ATP-dependent helicase YprA (DUF1998 family)